MFINIKPVRYIAKYIITLLFSISFLFVYSSNNIADTSSLSSEHESIKIVMSAAFVSDSGVGVYDDIFKYVGKKMNRKVEFVSGFSYRTINDMLDAGLVDVGFICGLPYTMKKDTKIPTVELLLAPVMKDQKYKNSPIYYSYIIVHKDSQFKEFSDLKGSHFTFNDEISNSGYNMPRAHLIEIGETNGFFKKVSRSGSHEESIRLVAKGKADVSAVDSLVYDYDMLNNPKYAQQTRVLKVLGPAGIPPVVVSTKVPLHLRKKIQDVLIGMNNDEEGKSILNAALVDRFVKSVDSNYDSIRDMYKKSDKYNYKVIR